MLQSYVMQSAIRRTFHTHPQISVHIYVLHLVIDDHSTKGREILPCARPDPPIPKPRARGGRDVVNLT